MARRRLTVLGQALAIDGNAAPREDGAPDVAALFALGRGVAEQVGAIVTAHERARGREGSCAKGCSACCEQLVPISTIEALWLARVVTELPAPRRAAVLRRFEDVLARLARAGMLVADRPSALRSPAPRAGESEWEATSRRYRELHLACPFLDAGSCSIHPARPLVCREYVAITPKERCAHPLSDGVETMPRPVRMSEVLATAMRAMEPDAAQATSLPLVLALRWVDRHGAQAEATLARAGAGAAETVLDCIEVEEDGAEPYL